MKWILLFSLSLLSFQTHAQHGGGADDAEELSYDDLVNELSARQRTVEVRSADSPFDQIQIHGGLGMINSFSTFEIAGKNASRSQNGMQMSLGVDLFSPNWMAEVAWRNFGLIRDQSEEHSLREFDLKLGYQNLIEGPWDYRFQAGIAQREFKLNDPARGLEIHAMTPAILTSASALLKMSPNASVNFEIGGRAPVVDQSADKGSLDFSVELKVSI